MEYTFDADWPSNDDDDEVDDDDVRRSLVGLQIIYVLSRKLTAFAEDHASDLWPCQHPKQEPFNLLMWQSQAQSKLEWTRWSDFQ